MKHNHLSHNTARLVVVLVILVIQGVGLTLIFSEADRQAREFHSDLMANQVAASTNALNLYLSSVIDRIESRLVDIESSGARSLLRADPNIVARFQWTRDGGIALGGGGTGGRTTTDIVSTVRNAQFAWDKKLHFAIPLITPSAQYAVLALRIDEDRYLGVLIDLHAVFDAYLGTAAIGETGSFWAVDQTETVLFDVETEIVGRSVLELHAQSASLLEMDRRMLEESSGTGRYRFLQRGTGREQNKLVAWQHLEIGDTTITVALSATAEEVTGRLGRLLFQVVAMVALSILVLAAYAYFSIRRERSELLDEEARLHRLVRQRSQESSEQETRYRTLFETANDAVIVADTETGIVVDVNTAATVLLQRGRDEIIGIHQKELHPPEETLNARDDFKTITEAPGGRRIVHGFHVVTAEGDRVPVEISTSIVEIDGATYAYGIFRDVSERRRIEDELRRLAEERTQLLREVLHRTKNNLNLVASLLSLQASEASNPVVQSALENAYNRVNALSEIQEILTHSDSVNTVQLDRYLDDLVRRLVASYPVGTFTIEIDLDLTPIQVPAKIGVNIGLIVNELVTNSVKYAFKTRGENPLDHSGSIGVSLWTSTTDPNRSEAGADDTASLRISDNGQGFPIESTPFGTEDHERFDTSHRGTRASLGLNLVKAISNQIDAQIAVESDSTGTRWTIVFPIT